MKLVFNDAVAGKSKNMYHSCDAYNRGYVDGLKQRQTNAIQSIGNK